MKNKEDQDVHELFTAENARVFTYPCIYVGLLAGYIFALRDIPYASVLPILIVLFMHFFYMKFESKNTSSLCNYSPIWSSFSLLFFALIFVSEIFIGNESFTMVIGMLGALVLMIIYFVALFDIYKDAGL